MEEQAWLSRYALSLPCLFRLSFLFSKIYLSGGMVFGFPTDVIEQLAVIHPVVRSSSLNGVTVRRVVELRDLRLLPW
jgi:hypothetical protein